MRCQVENERGIKYIFVIVSIFKLANIRLQGTGAHLKPNLKVQFLPEDDLPTHYFQGYKFYPRTM